MQTQTIVLGVNWRYLEGTEKGCLLQTEAGEVVYYVYSDYAPDPEATGFTEDATQGPSRLRGGNIWVKSKNWSRVSFQPYDVDGESIDVFVGSLPDLNTSDKSNVVNSINELVATKADKADVGNINNLLTPVKSNIVNAINSLKQRVDVVSGLVVWSGEVEITSQHIADKQLILPETPTGRVLFIPYGGVAQRMNHDFYVTGSVLTWDSLALELLLEVGDVIYIQFSREI